MIQALNLRAAEIAMEMQTLEELERDNLGASVHLLYSTRRQQMVFGACSWSRSDASIYV